MSKLTKIFRQSRGCFSDLLWRCFRELPGATPTYVVGFSRWKHYIRRYFPERRFIFLPKEISEEVFHARYREAILAQAGAEFFIWGYQVPPFLDQFLTEHGPKRFYVEDGFLRSVKLGASRVPARSLCLDTRGHHFDARYPSDLEVLLQTYEFDDAIRARARAAMEQLLRSGLSKYNHARSRGGDLPGGKGCRVLVIGQVEDDASILYGCSRPINNNDVVRLAAEENPGATIVYKVHPDVVSGFRPQLSNPEEVRHLCEILSNDLSLPDALRGIDHVYTMTSLGGFEALMRGIKVTTLGCPFYAGWGLTDDRQPNERRTRKLSLEEVFAGAYLLYPLYFEPRTGKHQIFEDSLESLAAEVAAERR